MINLKLKSKSRHFKSVFFLFTRFKMVLLLIKLYSTKEAGEGGQVEAGRQIFYECQWVGHDGLDVELASVNVFGQQGLYVGRQHLERGADALGIEGAGCDCGLQLRFRLEHGRRVARHQSALAQVEQRAAKLRRTVL